MSPSGFFLSWFHCLLIETIFSAIFVVPDNEIGMRAYKTLIFLTIVGAILVWGGEILFQFENVYQRVVSTNSKPEHTMFLGEWSSSSGTTICIKSDGKADFRSNLIFVQDATIQIKGAYLSIRSRGFNKIMFINDPPKLGTDGLWRMRLDGEVFHRMSQDLFVNAEADTIRKGQGCAFLEAVILA